MSSHDPAVSEQQRLRVRALELGNADDAAGAVELMKLLRSGYSEVRRLAASALGKLSGLSVNAFLVADALADVAERDEHPQVLRIRPDFYLPEFDLYIEYWGMDTPEYTANMKKKLFLYQRAGKKLISLSFKDSDRLEAVLEEKLSRYIRL